MPAAVGIELRGRLSIDRPIADAGDVGCQIAALIHDVGRAESSFFGSTQALRRILARAMASVVIDFRLDVLVDPIVNKDPGARTHGDLLVGEQTLGTQFPDVVSSETIWLTQQPVPVAGVALLPTR